MEIICKGVNGNLKVSVVKNEKQKRDNFWFTTDDDTIIGFDVVIENSAGARVSSKRIA